METVAVTKLGLLIGLAQSPDSFGIDIASGIDRVFLFEAAPPPGLRPGSLQYLIYREAAYQELNTKVNSMNHQLREYYEMKTQRG